jgi:hypothetical protein
MIKQNTGSGQVDFSTVEEDDLCTSLADDIVIAVE